MLGIQGPIRLTLVQWQIVGVLNYALDALPVPFVDLDTLKELDETLRQPYMITEKDCHCVATWVSTYERTVVFDRPSLAFYQLPALFSFSTV